MHAKRDDRGGDFLDLARLGMPIFFLLQFITVQIFSFFMPDPMTIRRGGNLEQQTYVPRRVAIWIGPILALLLGLLGTVTKAIGETTLLFVQAIVYLAMLYMYLINLQGRRRG